MNKTTYADENTVEAETAVIMVDVNRCSVFIINNLASHCTVSLLQKI